jgi:hypothetical protein
MSAPLAYEDFIAQRADTAGADKHGYRFAVQQRRFQGFLPGRIRNQVLFVKKRLQSSFLVQTLRDELDSGFVGAVMRQKYVVCFIHSIYLMTSTPES